MKTISQVTVLSVLLWTSACGQGSSEGDGRSMTAKTTPTPETQTRVDSSGTDELISHPDPKPTSRLAKFQPEDIFFNLQDNCGRCHDWVSVESDVKTKARTTIGRINSGNMPLGVSNWKNTTDGQALLRYLESLNQ